MLGSLSVMDRLNEITECSICSETFSDPRVLPCVHTFCLKCLQKTGQQLELNAGHKMSCPLCRDEFLIPEVGFIGLRRNFFMDNLIEMSMISNPVFKDKLCEICLENREELQSDVPAAAFYCVECRQNLCEHCSNEHKKQKLSKFHQILQLGAPLNDDIAKQFGQGFCEHHSGRSADMYCSDCSEVICMMCFAESHQSHRCTDVRNMADNFRKLLGKDVDEVAGCLSQSKSMKSMLEKERERFNKEVESTRVKVLERSDELRQMLEQQTKSLLEELDSLKTFGLKEMETEMKELVMHLNALETFKKYCEEMKSKGSPSDICRSMVDLRMRTEELKQVHDAQTKRPLCSLDISVRITEQKDYIHGNPNMVGEIRGSVTKLRQRVLATNNHPVASRLVKRLDIADRHVNGLARLDGRLYILLSDAVRVYGELEPFPVITELTISGMTTLVDIAACSLHPCLYITDKNKSCIWRLNTDHSASVILQDVDNPFTLSVSSEGKLVTVRWGNPSCVEIYATTLTKERRVNLPDNVILPYHAVLSSTGNVILSHGGRDSRTHRVLEISLEGVVLRTFPDDASFDHLNCPFYLALDPLNGRIFVANYYYGTVILLQQHQQKLKLDRILLLEEKDGVRRPNRLCYLEECQRLIVVNGSKFVDIYALDGLTDSSPETAGYDLELVKKLHKDAYGSPFEKESSPKHDGSEKFRFRCF